MPRYSSTLGDFLFPLIEPIAGCWRETVSGAMLKLERRALGHEMGFMDYESLSTGVNDHTPAVSQWICLRGWRRVLVVEIGVNLLRRHYERSSTAYVYRTGLTNCNLSRLSSLVTKSRRDTEAYF